MVEIRLRRQTIDCRFQTNDTRALPNAPHLSAAMHNEHMVHADFNLAPFTIAWEVTRACAYACVHCRADAMHIA